MKTFKVAAAALALCTFAAGPPASAQSVRGAGSLGRHVGDRRRGAAPGRGARRLALPGPPALNFNRQTLRQIVHTSLGGDRVRVVLSNAFGSGPLAIGAANVALREKDASIVPSSARPLTFGGSPRPRLRRAPSRSAIR